MMLENIIILINTTISIQKIRLSFFNLWSTNVPYDIYAEWNWKYNVKNAHVDVGAMWSIRHEE